MCARSNLCDHLGVLRPVVVNEDADSAGYEHQDQRDDDVEVGHGVLQVEALTVQVEQQRHHAQSQQRGAGRHHNAESKNTQEGSLIYPNCVQT